MRPQQVFRLLTTIGAISFAFGMMLYFIQPVGTIEINPEDIDYVLMGFTFGFSGVGALFLLISLFAYLSLAKPGPIRPFNPPASSPEERIKNQERYKERVQEALNLALGKQKEITPNEIVFAVESISYTKDDFCMVCKLVFKRKDEILQCPVCESFYHKEHLLDWIRVHSNCPVCNQQLYEIKS